jgi:predicted DsbA family dithiol-disulfide isomerase
VRNAYPEKYDRYVRSLLTLAYQEKDSPGSRKTLAVAAHVAELDADEVLTRAHDPGLDLLRRATEDARALGVTKVPTIVRQGPPVHVKMNAASNYGDPVERLELINRMINDDGMWELSKP